MGRFDTSYPSDYKLATFKSRADRPGPGPHRPVGRGQPRPAGPCRAGV